MRGESIRIDHNKDACFAHIKAWARTIPHCQGVAIFEYAEVSLVLCGPVEVLLRDPKRWTRKTYCRDEIGAALPVKRIDDASCFCLTGAIIKCYGFRLLECKCKILCDILGQKYTAWNKARHQIADWNDAPGRTYSEVLNLVRKAGL